MFADNGLSDVKSFLYFPADPAQMIAIIQRVFFDHGLRFVFSTRSKVPWILKEDGKTRFFDEKYEFVPGKDEVIAEGKAGYVISFGEMLYRSWDAVLRCREEGLDVGLINKPSLNIVDEEVISYIFGSCFVFLIQFYLSRQLGRLVKRHLCSSLSRSTERRGYVTLYICNLPVFGPDVCHVSSDPSSEHGFWNVSSHPSMPTWEPPKKVCLLRIIVFSAYSQVFQAVEGFGSKSLTKTSILLVSASMFALSVRSCISTTCIAIISKIKELAQRN